MERSLLIAGRILAALLILVAALLLEVLVVGTTFISAASTIPATVVRTLDDQNFTDQVAQGAVTSILDRIPDEITVRGIAIKKSTLVDAIKSGDPVAFAREMIPKEWLQEQLIAALTGAAGGSD